MKACFNKRLAGFLSILAGRGLTLITQHGTNIGLVFGSSVVDSGFNLAKLRCHDLVVAFGTKEE